MYHFQDEPGCRECGSGAVDYGYEMSDVRSTLEISTCDATQECADGECECESIPVKVTIRRVSDGFCEACGDSRYRCVYDLTLEGDKIKTFKSEHEADAYAARVFPSAKPPERDFAWESEAGLRRAEGWGC